MSENTVLEQPAPHTTVVFNQLPPKKNGMGTAGFILALLGFFLSWIPILGWIMWLLGLIFSIVGLFKEPKGFAVAGLIISLISLIVLILLVTVFAGLIGAAALAA